MNRTRKQKTQLTKFLQSAGLSNEDIQNMQGRKNGGDRPSVKRQKIIKKKSFKGFNTVSRMKKVSYQSEKKKQQNGKKDDEMEDQSIDLIPGNFAFPLTLEKVIQKIPIVKIEKEFILQGCFGHATVIFKRPIIEGSYYLEFKQLPFKIDELKNKINNTPSVRLGICPFEYPLTVPIGHGNSIGCKIGTGELVTEGKPSTFRTKFSESAVIGLGLTFSPPQKYQNKDLVSDGSKITFYKNGVQTAEFQEIKQQFYTPAISLYNYARIEVRHNRAQLEYLPENMKPYGEIFNEEIPYDDLKKTMIFSDFVQK